MCFHNSPAFRVIIISPVRILSCVTIALMISIQGASAQCPPPATVFVENQVTASGANATVGFRDCGEFIIAWEAPIVGSPNDRDILVQRFNPDGSLFDISQMPIPVSGQPEAGAFHWRASLAMSPLGNVSIAWSGIRGPAMFNGDALLDISFDFGDVASITPVEPPQGGEQDVFASVGTSDATGPGGNLFAVSWSRVLNSTGLLFQVPPTQDLIRPCSTFCVNRSRQWQPCVSMRPSDGFVAVAWADAGPNPRDSRHRMTRGGVLEWMRDALIRQGRSIRRK